MRTKLVLDPKNPDGLVAFVREFLTDTQSAYQGIIDQVPESLRTQVKALKDKIDSALTSLASRPTDQVPAALDAASALNHVAYTLNYMQEAFSGTMDALNRMLGELTPKATALQALQGRIDKHELVEATEIETRVKEAVEKEQARFKLLGQRRSLLQKANVPLPLDDEVLSGDDKAFTAVQTKATERVKKLTDLGQISQLNGEDLAHLIYGPDDQFGLAIKLSEAASKRSGTTADPMVGGRTDTKPRRIMLV